MENTTVTFDDNDIEFFKKHGISVNKNTQYLLTYFDPSTYTALGNYHYYNKRFANMKKYYEIACDMKNIDAMEYLGTYYKHEKNFHQMKKYYLMGIENNNNTCLRNLTEFLEKYDEKTCDLLCCEKVHKYDLLKKLYLKGVKCNDIHMMFGLCLYYKNIEIDYDEMKKYYLMVKNTNIQYIHTWKNYQDIEDIIETYDEAFETKIINFDNLNIENFKKYHYTLSCYAKNYTLHHKLFNNFIYNNDIDFNIVNKYFFKAIEVEPNNDTIYNDLSNYYLTKSTFNRDDSDIFGKIIMNDDFQVINCIIDENDKILNIYLSNSTLIKLNIHYNIDIVKIAFANKQDYKMFVEKNEHEFKFIIQDIKNNIEIQFKKNGFFGSSQKQIIYDDILFFTHILQDDYVTLDDNILIKINDVKNVEIVLENNIYKMNDIIMTSNNKDLYSFNYANDNNHIEHIKLQNCKNLTHYNISDILSIVKILTIIGDGFDDITFFNDISFWDAQIIRIENYNIDYTILINKLEYLPHLASLIIKNCKNVDNNIINIINLNKMCCERKIALIII